MKTKLSCRECHTPLLGKPLLKTEAQRGGSFICLPCVDKLTSRSGAPKTMVEFSLWYSTPSREMINTLQDQVNALTEMLRKKGRRVV